MFDSINFKTVAKAGIIPQFIYRYISNPSSTFRSLLVVFAEDEHDCIVFSDKELPIGNTYEIRGDGIWADSNCEIKNEHWSFSMESFALRTPIDEYLAFKQTEDGLLIGDRIPFGYELDATTSDGENWMLSGEILVEKNEIEISDMPIRFELK